ncbi:MAG: hypothetical protein ISR70_00765 [Candidatus Thioglobus sp.]|nr:hypothetical protein [Candidatus Thioglobus pontius]MBL6976576.1 hypothetical protein [Candidatus Thioglobus sp.]MBL6984816.1 hypothetical protein [Candidatus Thioglobus sp.]
MDLLNKINNKTHSNVLPLSVIDTVLVGKSSDAKRSFIKRTCQNGRLIRVKNGLYLRAADLKNSVYNAFSVANYIITPSYVSLESALSFYGLIPEAVYTTTSVTTRKTSNTHTPVGLFSFSHLKIGYFNFGFYQIKKDNDAYLIATPLKALMDFIVLKGKEYDSVSDMVEDLRFDWNEFVGYKEFVNIDEINNMLKIYKSYRLQVILKSIKDHL